MGGRQLHYLAQDRDAIMHLQVPQNAENFLTKLMKYLPLKKDSARCSQ